MLSRIKKNHTLTENVQIELHNHGGSEEEVVVEEALRVKDCTPQGDKQWVKSGRLYTWTGKVKANSTTTIKYSAHYSNI